MMLHVTRPTPNSKKLRASKSTVTQTTKDHVWLMTARCHLVECVCVLVCLDLSIQQLAINSSLIPSAICPQARPREQRSPSDDGAVTAKPGHCPSPRNAICQAFPAFISGEQGPGGCQPLYGPLAHMLDAELTNDPPTLK